MSPPTEIVCIVLLFVRSVIELSRASMIIILWPFVLLESRSLEASSSRSLHGLLLVLCWFCCCCCHSFMAHAPSPNNSSNPVLPWDRIRVHLQHDWPWHWHDIWGRDMSMNWNNKKLCHTFWRDLVHRRQSHLCIGPNTKPWWETTNMSANCNACQSASRRTNDENKSKCIFNRTLTNPSQNNPNSHQNPMTHFKHRSTSCVSHVCWKKLLWSPNLFSIRFWEHWDEPERKEEHEAVFSGKVTHDWKMKFQNCWAALCECWSAKVLHNRLRMNPNASNLPKHPQVNFRIHVVSLQGMELLFDSFDAQPFDNDKMLYLSDNPEEPSHADPTFDAFASPNLALASDKCKAVDIHSWVSQTKCSAARNRVQPLREEAEQLEQAAKSIKDKKTSEKVPWVLILLHRAPPNSNKFFSHHGASVFTLIVNLGLANQPKMTMTAQGGRRKMGKCWM